MMFLNGCTHEIVTTQMPIKRADISSLLNIKRDFNYTANNEQEAALLVWDLYLYTQELNSALQSCVELHYKSIKD